MERRTAVLPIRLLNHEHIDRAAEGGWIDFAVELADLLESAPNKIHPDMCFAITLARNRGSWSGNLLSRRAGGLYQNNEAYSVNESRNIWSTASKTKLGKQC
jgi:hypothetical protein